MASRIQPPAPGNSAAHWFQSFLDEMTSPDDVIQGTAHYLSYGTYRHWDSKQMHGGKHLSRFRYSQSTSNFCKREGRAGKANYAHARGQCVEGHIKWGAVAPPSQRKERVKVVPESALERSRHCILSRMSWCTSRQTGCRLRVTSPPLSSATEPLGGHPSRLAQCRSQGPRRLAHGLRATAWRRPDRPSSVPLRGGLVTGGGRLHCRRAAAPSAPATGTRRAPGSRTPARRPSAPAGTECGWRRPWLCRRPRPDSSSWQPVLHRCRRSGKAIYTAAPALSSQRRSQQTGNRHRNGHCDSELTRQRDRRGLTIEQGKKPKPSRGRSRTVLTGILYQCQARAASQEGNISTCPG